MSMITATAQREISVSKPTEAELSAKYKFAVDLVKRQTGDRKFSVAVSIGQDDLAEFTGLFEQSGFKVLPIAEKPTPFPESVRYGTVGTLVYRLVFWGEVKIIRPQNAIPLDQAARGRSHSWTVTVVGINPGQTLYWRDSGTALNADFSDTTKQGTLTINSQNQAEIIRTVSQQPAEAAPDTTPPVEPRTIVLDIYLDADRTQLLARAASVSIV
jgi:hypothetical protein